MIFNGFDFETIAVVEEIRSTLTPEISWPSQKIPGRGGVRLGERQIGSRLIEVDLRLLKDSRPDVTDAATQIAARLLTDAPARLETRRDVGRWWMAVFTGAPELKQLFETGFSALEFFAPEGLAYSDEVTGSLVSGVNSVTVAGTWQTCPEIKMILSAAAGTATIAVNNVTVTVKKSSGTWPTNSEIKLDFASRQAWINGVKDNSVILIGSRFEPLVPGANTVNLGNGAGTIKYYPRWL